MNILVLGDMIIDHYQYHDAVRVCPEAPALVLHFNSKNDTEGGAALVANNLRSLSPNANITAFYGSMSHKTRIFADRTLICRIDDDSVKLVSPEQYAKSIGMVIDQMDLVVISDYGKGAIIGNEVIKLVFESGKPVFVDAKYEPERYVGAFALFPNEREPAPLGIADHIIRKLGARGATVDGHLVDTTPQRVYDVSGAGDVFLAAFVSTYMTLRTMPFDHDPQLLKECAEYANVAAGISVRRIGTCIVTPQEVHSELKKEVTA